MSKNNFPIPKEGFYTDAFVITPHDDNNLTQVPQAIYVGVTGDIMVHMTMGGQTRLFKNVPAGEFRIRPHRVLATGTTATDLMGLL